MAKIQIETDKPYPPTVEAGTHRAVVQKAVFAPRAEDAPFDAGLNYVTWHLRWDDPDLPDEVNGSLTFGETCTEPYKNAMFQRFMEGVGRDPSSFEIEDDSGAIVGIEDIPVMARVTHRLGRPNEEGERRVFVRVVHLSQP